MWRTALGSWCVLDNLLAEHAESGCVAGDVHGARVGAAVAELLVPRCAVDALLAERAE